jgi:hypothetical protein
VAASKGGQHQMMVAPDGSMAIGGDEDADEGEDEDDEDDDQPHQAWSDHFLPGAISKAQLSDSATRMRLTDDQRTIVADLHRTYLEKFDVIAKGDIAAATRASTTIWSHDPATGKTLGPSEASIAELRRLRLSAMAAIRATDDAFFDEVAIVVEKDQVPLVTRVRSARLREVYNRQQAMGYYGYGGESSEASVDLATLVQRQRLPEPMLKAIDAELAKYEEAAVEAFRNRYDVALAMQDAMYRWQSLIMQAQSEGGSVAAESARYQEFLGEPMRQLTQANGAITNLNRAALDALAALLPGDTAYALRADFNRAAFPNVYTDPMSVERQLNQAAKLPDLTDEQRRGITELAAEYRPAYTSVCEQMIQVSAWTEHGALVPGDADASREFMNRQEKLGTLRYDRGELNHRAIARLKSILSEAQINQIGGLPEPKESDNPFETW